MKKSTSHISSTNYYARNHNGRHGTTNTQTHTKKLKRWLLDCTAEQNTRFPHRRHMCNYHRLHKSRRVVRRMQGSRTHTHTFTTTKHTRYLSRRTFCKTIPKKAVQLRHGSNLIGVIVQADSADATQQNTSQITHIHTHNM